jgi:hypothetical protein
MDILLIPSAIIISYSINITGRLIAHAIQQREQGAASRLTTPAPDTGDRMSIRGAMEYARMRVKRCEEPYTCEDAALDLDDDDN